MRSKRATAAAMPACACPPPTAPRRSPVDVWAAAVRASVATLVMRGTPAAACVPARCPLMNGRAQLCVCMCARACVRACVLCRGVPWLSIRNSDGSAKNNARKVRAEMVDQKKQVAAMLTGGKLLLAGARSPGPGRAQKTGCYVTLSCGVASRCLMTAGFVCCEAPSDCRARDATPAFLCTRMPVRAGGVRSCSTRPEPAVPVLSRALLPHPPGQ